MTTHPTPPVLTIPTRDSEDYTKALDLTDWDAGRIHQIAALINRPDSLALFTALANLTDTDMQDALVASIQSLLPEPHLTQTVEQAAVLTDQLECVAETCAHQPPTNPCHRFVAEMGAICDHCAAGQAA